MCLLNDEILLETIKWDNQHSGEIVDDILDHWIHRQGQHKNTWDTLVDCLRFAEQHTLADEMESVLLFCDDHDEILCALERSYYNEKPMKAFHSLMTGALFVGSAVLTMTYHQLKGM